MLINGWLASANGIWSDDLEQWNTLSWTLPYCVNSDIRLPNA